MSKYYSNPTYIVLPKVMRWDVLATLFHFLHREFQSALNALDNEETTASSNVSDWLATAKP